MAAAAAVLVLDGCSTLSAIFPKRRDPGTVEIVSLSEPAAKNTIDRQGTASGAVSAGKSGTAAAAPKKPSASDDIPLYGGTGPLPAAAPQQSAGASDGIEIIDSHESSVPPAAPAKAESQWPAAKPAAPAAEKAPAENAKLLQASSILVKKGISTAGSGSIYIEKIAVDAPYKHDTAALTAAVEKQIRSSGKFTMADSRAVSNIRGSLEYQNVSGGNWASLIKLAKSQNIDKAFYGAIGSTGDSVYLDYSIIDVKSGAILWEDTVHVDGAAR
jgi:PBP1b-binding outer membrane lipoprotein LpoB